MRRLSFALAVLLATTTIGGCSDPAPAHPNILVVVTDDQGWGDFGFNGNDIVETPVLDELAASSTVFDRFYVSPVCSSTRASLLTGRHFLRTGVWSVTRGGEKMRAAETTIGEHFKSAGYRTGLFGKWHNGAQYPYRANDQGFETFFGFQGGHLTRYFDATLEENGRPVATTGFVPDVLTDAAIGFIEDGDQRPFLAVVAYNTPHSPFELPGGDFEHFRGKGMSDLDSAVYGLVRNIDINVGRLLTSIQDAGISNNTIVVFLSDNGPAFPGGKRRFNGELRGNKGKTTEGGIRVPLLLHWPGHVDAGQRVDTLAQHIDLLPTLAELAGIATPVAVDGQSLVAALDGPGDADRILFTSHFRNTRRSTQQAIQPWPAAVHFRNWTAVRESAEEWGLYDLASDPGQEQSLAAKKPELLAQLAAEYERYFDDVTSQGFESLPAVLDAQAPTEILLPAHEADIRGDAFNYAHQFGWAEDWLKALGGNGQASWPLRVTEAADIEILLSYATSAGDTALSVRAGDTRIEVRLDGFESAEIPGRRVYETGEAVERTWREIAVLRTTLEPGTHRITLESSGPGLLVKAVTVVPRRASSATL